MYGLNVELFLGKSKDCANPYSKTNGLVLYIHNSSFMVTEELMSKMKKHLRLHREKKEEVKRGV